MGNWIDQDKSFYGFDGGLHKHYWCCVKLLSAALPFFFVWGNTMKCLRPCVTHVYKCTVTSSSASETNPSPLCDVFSVLTVCNEVVVSGSRLCLPAGLSIGVAVYDMFLPTCEDPHWLHTTIWAVLTNPSSSLKQHFEVGIQLVFKCPHFPRVKPG